VKEATPLRYVPLRNVAPELYAPAYLGPDDLPWLQVLLDEAGRLRGRPRGELQARLAEPFWSEVAPWKMRLCGRVLLALDVEASPPRIPPRELRRAVFMRAARGEARERVLEAVAEALGVSLVTIEDGLYADLASMRRLPDFGAELGPGDLAERANLALVQSLVARTRSLVIRAVGGAGDLARHAKREGLLCTVHKSGEDAYDLDVSGPLALFKKTVVYGRALAGLVSRLSWCRQWVLETIYETEHDMKLVVVRSGDPIAQGREPVRYERELEQRFVRDLARVAPDWEVLRDPGPVEIGEGVVFPDFALVSRKDPRLRWMIDVVGFWTPGWLGKRLAWLQGPDASRLVVCVDEARACDADELPPGARIVRFRGHIDPREVLRAMVGQIDHGL
jgi:predicted nuclease of restriction endonuclease-like RecB superfamily